MVATHLILVDAAPVTVTASPPFVVSADNASAHPGWLSMTVSAELTRTVEAALASRRISPFTSHAAEAVPPAADWRATTMPVKA